MPLKLKIEVSSVTEQETLSNWDAIVYHVVMRLTLDPQLYAVCRLPVSSDIPDWAVKGSFFSINKTLDELSIVCDQQDVPLGIQSEQGWNMFKVQGPLDFTLTGILASIANPLAQAQVSIFAISTFDTDYVMIKASHLKVAVECLKSAGFFLGWAWVLIADLWALIFGWSK